MRLNVLSLYLFPWFFIILTERASVYSFWQMLALKLLLKVDSCLGLDSGFVIVNPHTLVGSQTIVLK